MRREQDLQAIFHSSSSGLFLPSTPHGAHVHSLLTFTPSISVCFSQKLTAPSLCQLPSDSNFLSAYRPLQNQKNCPL
ncbi:hypothetical protein VIGAN_10083100 [Vigna angularis var. angularis]|uniref:Uncharacterized protein n=1 Tax=Vigna angularis var. angularis TaxID=157739 RepID=A0A0S3T2D8_PHAAN|nr:hypothetical protein VIGAN_10083100 [Vigna angularis var. angularis]